MSPQKSQQCGQSATHDGMFSSSPAMVIAAMVIRNMELRNYKDISHECVLNGHHFAEIRLEIGNIRLRYTKIGSKITNMLENAPQSIACDFDTSQGL